MLRSGVNVALGTDGAASNHSQDLFETMKTASLLQKVHHQNAGSSIPMCPAHGHRRRRPRFRLSSSCGTIDVGKRADLILIRLDAVHNQPVNDLFSQLVHCAKASDVQTVIVDGRVVMRDRQLQITEEGRVLEQARTANQDLMNRLSALSF
jgi:5-methylthioadenosine/S-adenosylhomocysteine deaminase